MPTRRYCCTSAVCGWQGLLAHSRRKRPLHRAAVGAVDATGQLGLRLVDPGRRLLIGAAVALAFAVPAVVLLLAALGTHVGSQAALGLPAGVSHDGVSLRPAGWQLAAVNSGEAARLDPDTRLATVTNGAVGALALRQGCAWGEPGRDPYRGSTEQALQAAGLPTEVVQSIAAQRAAGRSAERLRITRDGIRSEAGSRYFDPRRIDLSFGMTMCRGSRVNFAPGHVEQADLYLATDAQGRLHAVMVPDVCGNVSVLRAAGDQGVVASVVASLEDRAVALSSLAQELLDPEPDELLRAEPDLNRPRGGGLSMAAPPPPGGGSRTAGHLPTASSGFSAPGWPTLLTAKLLRGASATLTGGSAVLRTLSGSDNPPPEGGPGSPPGGGGGSGDPPPVLPPSASSPPVPVPPQSASAPPVPVPPPSASSPPVPEPPASQPKVQQPPASQPRPPGPPPRALLVPPADPPPHQVPESGSLVNVLLALGLAGLVMRWRRRR